METIQIWRLLGTFYNVSELDYILLTEIILYNYVTNYVHRRHLPSNVSGFQIHVH